MGLQGPAREVRNGGCYSINLGCEILALRTVRLIRDERRINIEQLNKDAPTVRLNSKLLVTT